MTKSKPQAKGTTKGKNKISKADAISKHSKQIQKPDKIAVKKFIFSLYYTIKAGDVVHAASKREETEDPNDSVLAMTSLLARVSYLVHGGDAKLAEQEVLQPLMRQSSYTFAEMKVLTEFMIHRAEELGMTVKAKLCKKTIFETLEPFEQSMFDYKTA